MKSSPISSSRVRVIRMPGRFAVLLNARAKGWTGKLHHDIQRFVSAQDLYLTDDFRQAERTVDKLLAANYDAIFTGGGDGTICYLMSAIDERIQSGAVRREDAPPVGVLRMGTGNAIATFVGAGAPAEDLRALKAGAPLIVHDVDMLEGPEGLFPFAGIGWDAEVLNDYEWLKDAVRDTAVENYATGMGGYWMSMLSRTIPKAMRQKPVDVTITNTADVAFGLDYSGRVIREYERGEVLYAGEVTTCAPSTIPYWGFKIRMFPHASKRAGFANLRCFDGTVPWILSHLPRYWKGDFRPEDMVDFLIKRVSVEIHGRPIPYQVAGDGVGYERELDWKVADHPVRLAVPMH
jgi:diacylglycerol kinase family enzyme